jgi:DNA helicase-2/ATP-dependent DNA helicase PcrA
MTVHAAKGLEFPYVFLCGMNEGVLPSRKTDTEKGMEEERRLAFVAMTRARRGLRLSEAEGWTPEGAPRYPSRFLLEIDPDLLEFTAKPSEPLLAAARDYIRLSAQKLAGSSDPSLLAVGQRVRHPVFGPGVIEDIEPAKGAYLVRFEALSTPRSISFRAKLERMPPPGHGDQTV